MQINRSANSMNSMAHLACGNDRPAGLLFSNFANQQFEIPVQIHISFSYRRIRDPGPPSNLSYSSPVFSQKKGPTYTAFKVAARPFQVWSLRRSASSLSTAMCQTPPFQRRLLTCGTPALLTSIPHSSTTSTTIATAIAASNSNSNNASLTHLPLVIHMLISNPLASSSNAPPSDVVLSPPN